MSFWQIMKYTLRELFSFDLDLRATRDDIYDDEGNVLLMGPWLYQAEIVFKTATLLIGIIISLVSICDIVYAHPIFFRVVFILSIILLPFLLSSLYVACKRAVYIKKHGHMPMHRKQNHE